MFFTLSKVVWFLIHPGNLILIGLVAGGVLLWTRWRRAGVAVLGVTIAVAVVLSTVPFGTALRTVLENRFPVVDVLPERVDGVIVLGGVVDPGLTLARGQIAVNASAERLIAFAELGERFPEARMIFTGGSGSLLEQELKEAHYVAPLLARMGLDPGRVVFEDRSRNTHENATLSKALMTPAPGEAWVLVTSAAHMPRAVGCFRAVGWPGLIPYPVDFSTRGGVSWAPMFSLSGGTGVLAAGLREWVGLVVYFLSGRTDALFPAPES